MKPRAVALFSGGLDSTLAVLLMLRQGIEVVAVTFLNDFGCAIGDTSSCTRDPEAPATRFGFALKLCHLGPKFLEIVKRPPHGHGRNMNPCIDCRILMLREARELMAAVGASFVVTGEVLGQRPMSQHRPKLDLIDRESGLRGLIVRPLSGRLLPPTVPETSGLIARDGLLAISGRSRKTQMELARELGLESYPTPSGGCLLTDPAYARRLRDLLAERPECDTVDVQLLRHGRHFRLSGQCKAIIGRNEADNRALERLRRPGDRLLRVVGAPGPSVLLIGDDAANCVGAAAALCALYSDARERAEVQVEVEAASGRQLVSCRPADRERTRTLLLR